MSIGPDLEQYSRKPERERNWMPLVIASGVVILAILLVILLNRGKRDSGPASPTAPLDPYAASLSIESLAMSESGNLAGGKVTYIDGILANHGNRTVTGVSVQVLFRDGLNQVAQNELQPIKLVRTRVPYIDLEALSAEPIPPGGHHAFRLSFDGVHPNWNFVMPELRILHVDLK